MIDGRDNELSIIIGADILPNSDNYDLFSTGNTVELLGDNLTDILRTADFRVFNLEGPLTDKKQPVLKVGPVLEAPENTIAGLAAMNTDLLALSNNHIRDHGAYGIQRTLKLARNNKIACIGVGKNRIERSRPYFFEKKGIRIGIYNCCENEESVAAEGEYGSNPYDPLYSFDDVEQIKKECDFQIVLYHGGKEYFRYPSPMLVRRFRKFAEKGADIVIAQHTHCIGSYENYNGSLLLYGQGNFLFGQTVNEYTNNGLLLNVNVSLSKDASYRYEFLPLQKHGSTVRLAKGKEADKIMNAFQARSINIQDEKFVIDEYNKKADEYLTYYLNSIRGHLFMGKILKTLFKGVLDDIWMKYKYPPRLSVLSKNIITCEAHQELLLTGLDRAVSGKRRQK